MADDPQEPPTDPKPDDKPDLGDAGKKAIQAEREARKKAEQQAKELADRLKAIEDKDKSEVERLTEQVKQLEKDRDTATVSAARLKVALSKGLTMSQAKRLVGSTDEELEADADELLADLGAATPTPPAKPAGKPREDLKPGSGDPDLPPEETDVRRIGERMFSN